MDLKTCFYCRREIAEFATECKKIGTEYIGLFCGNSSHFLRIVAETYGKNPAVSKYSLDTPKQYIFGKKRKGGIQIVTSPRTQKNVKKQHYIDTWGDF